MVFWPAHGSISPHRCCKSFGETVLTVENVRSGNMDVLLMSPPTSNEPSGISWRRLFSANLVYAIGMSSNAGAIQRNQTEWMRSRGARIALLKNVINRSFVKDEAGEFIRKKQQHTMSKEKEVHRESDDGRCPSWPFQCRYARVSGMATFVLA